MDAKPERKRSEAKKGLTRKKKTVMDRRLQSSQEELNLRDSDC